MFWIYDIFPGNEKKFPEITNSSFQKCSLGKKCNVNDIFHTRKGHFAPGKRALGKTWGALAPPCPPPGSYGSGVYYMCSITVYIIRGGVLV